MKRQGLTILTLALALLPAALYAQMNGATIQADVPFSFTAGDKTIPAGTVIVRPEGPSGGALWVSNRDANANTYVVPMPTRALNPSDRTALVFHKYGDRYFLARVERSGSDAGYQLQETKVEKELRSQNKIAGEEIRLAAK